MSKSKLPTINDVARVAGVSKRTVSRVINNSPSVSSTMKAKVAKTMEDLQFFPDPRARGLASSRSFLIALVYDNPNDVFIADVQKGALKACRAAGCDLVVHPASMTSNGLVNEVINLISRGRFDGLILLSPVSQHQELVEALEEGDYNYVRVQSARSSATNTTVVVDDYSGGAAAANHLASLGHQRIGLISGPVGWVSADARKNGFRETLANRGIEMDDDIIVEGSFTFESGINCARILLESPQRPTAIFASNDQMACGTIHAARRMGLRVPDDLSVVGFDDSILAARIWPPLSTVRQPMVELGHRAAVKVLRRYDESATLNSDLDSPLQPELVTRDSTAPLNIKPD